MAVQYPCNGVAVAIHLCHCHALLTRPHCAACSLLRCGMHAAGRGLTPAARWYGHAGCPGRAPSPPLGPSRRSWQPQHGPCTPAAPGGPRPPYPPRPATSAPPSSTARITAPTAAAAATAAAPAAPAPTPAAALIGSLPSSARARPRQTCSARRCTTQPAPSLTTDPTAVCSSSLARWLAAGAGGGTPGCG